MTSLSRRKPNQSKHRQGAVGVFVALAMFTVTPALAQPASPQSSNAVSPHHPHQSGLLKEIVVTATRHKEREVNVPISIASVSAAQLQANNISDVVDLPQLVPALRITYSGTFVQPTIRGIGSQVALPGLPQNIATYMDGYYVPDPAADDFNLVDIQSVSVLEGPQGTLFGFNATGGAILVNTKNPQQAPSAFARVGLSSYGHISDAFYGTTGITDDLAVNAAWGYDHGDGYFTNILTNNHDAAQFTSWYLRTKALWTPADGISFLFAYMHDSDNNPLTQMVTARNGESIAIAVPGAVISTKPYDVSLQGPTYARLNSNSYTLTSKFDLGFANLISYTGYREDEMDQGLDYTASSVPLNDSAWSVPDKTSTEELDLVSKSAAPLNWVAGLFYMHYTDSYDYVTNDAKIFDSKNTTDSYAAFGNVTYEIAHNLYLTGGGRYSIDRPSVAFDLFPYSLAESGYTEFHNFSGRGVLRYQLTPDSNVYASFTQGYKAGGLPASAFSLVPVKPETINAYEVGYKIATSRVRADVAAFYYDYKNVQVTTYGAGGQSITVNAALVHSVGIDGDVTLRATRHLNLTLNGGFTHAYYVSFPDATSTVQNLDPVSPSYGAISLVPFNASGLPVERTPRFSGNIGGDYHFSLAGGLMNLNANLFYTQHFYFDVAEQLPQKAYTLLNLRATWTAPSGRLDLSIYSTNVTGSTYLISNFTDPYASRAVYGAPRIIGGSVTYHF